MFCCRFRSLFSHGCSQTQLHLREKVQQQMPLLGHRNWTAIADSAYPWQVSPGVETVETNEDHVKILKEVLRAISSSIHVRANVFLDLELPHVPNSDAPWHLKIPPLASSKALAGRNLQYMLHEKIIGKLDESGKTFHVLLLKTNLAIPYTSVFLELDCKYWSGQAEERLRKATSH